MAKFATFDSAGNITGHYDDKVNKQIPSGAIELTDEEWQESCGGNLWIDPDTKAIVTKPASPGTDYIWQAGAWVWDVATARSLKEDEIRSALATHEIEPVQDTTNNVTWDGGYDSYQKLDGAYRFAQRTGATQVTFWDVDNVGHTFDLATADVVVQLVAGKYESDFAHKQDLMDQAAAATTKAEMDAIVW